MGRDLAARAAAQNGRGDRNGSTPGGDGEREDGIQTLRQQIERMAPEYQRAMPKGAEAAQLIRDALTCLRTIRKLSECEPASVLGALMTCAQLGLRPGVPGLGHAWPLPFWDGRDRCQKAQLVIGYQGYIELGHRSGKLKDIFASVVYAEDRDFDYWRDEEGPHLVHKPALDGKRETIRAFYSIARLVNGGVQITEPTSLATMEAHRDRFGPRDRNGKLTGPWVDHFAGMGRKTTILQVFHVLPKSAEMAIGMQVDDGVRVDLNPEANAAEVTEHRVVPGRVEPEDAEYGDSRVPVEDPPGWDGDPE